MKTEELINELQSFGVRLVDPKAGAEMLQADLAKVGIRLQIKVLEWGELIKRGKAGEHEMLFMGWAGDNGDPDNFLSPLFTCDAVKGGTNFPRYCDAALDQAIASGKATSSAATRAKFYQSAQKIVYDDALWLPLAHPLVVAITRANVTGYRVSPFGRVNFDNVAFK